MSTTATPMKPWEARGAAGMSAEASRSFSSAPLTQTRSSPSVSNSSPSAPPTIPPRTTTTYSNPYSATGYYNQGFGSSYGYGGYGGHGGLRPFGMYGSGYGGGGLGYGGGGLGYGSGPYNNGSGESQFVQQAEARTRTAFQSVESVVGAFASVSMMLESTYFAVHSCFRAVLGVAQHFARLKNHIWSIIAAVALLRRLRYWLKRILRLLRFRQSGASEEAWDDASLEQNALQLSRAAQSSGRLWPIVAFLVTVIGVPWLLWRILASVSERQESEATESWSAVDDQPVVARALYDFTAEGGNELSFSVGDELVLAPHQLQSGWLLAGKNRQSGLVPANYLRILSPSGASPRSSAVSLPHPQQSSTDAESAPDPQRSPSRDLLNQEESLLTD